MTITSSPTLMSTPSPDVNSVLEVDDGVDDDGVDKNGGNTNNGKSM